MMLKWIDKFFDRACAVVGALAFSQAPVFFQQYTQQLSGRTLELKHQVEAMQGSAALSKKSLAEYIAKFIGSGDSDFSAQGELMQYIVDRYSALQGAWEAMQQATVWSRPFAFAKHFQLDIAQATFTDFHPAFALTAEGLCYACLGLVLGFALYLGTKKVVIAAYRGVSHLFFHPILRTGVK